MFRPASLLPYPKATIRRCLEALLDYSEGRATSKHLDESMQTPEAAESIRKVLFYLDDFIDVAPSDLPTDPGDNRRVGFSFLGTIGGAAET